MLLPLVVRFSYEIALLIMKLHWQGIFHLTTEMTHHNVAAQVLQELATQ